MPMQVPVAVSKTVTMTVTVTMRMATAVSADGDITGTTPCNLPFMAGGCRRRRGSGRNRCEVLLDRLDGIGLLRADGDGAARRHPSRKTGPA